MIYEITPYARDKRFGIVLNEHIKLLPDDAWVCIRDRDTFYLLDSSGAMMEDAIADNPDCKLFSCASNRCYGQPMNHNTDILYHYNEAVRRSTQKCYSPILGIVPAMFWLFPKSLWMQQPFDELPIVANGRSFDVRWTKNMTVQKLRIEHLYLFHYYRMHKRYNDSSHLL